MTHTMSLQPTPFAAIAQGRKSIEMRLYDEKRAAIRVGDEIVFTNAETAQTLCVTVTGLFRYPDFEALYAHHEKMTLGYAPGEVADPDDMTQYYAPELIRAYGVLAIQIAPKKD